MRTFFETTEVENRLAAVGREMMDYSEEYGRYYSLGKLKDHQLKQLNELSHVGNMLTRIGTTFGTSASSFSTEDEALIQGFISKTLEVQKLRG